MNIPELFECVEAMVHLGEAPRFMMLCDHVIPGNGLSLNLSLNLSLSQPCLALQMLQNAGLSTTTTTTTTTPILVVLVKNNIMEHAI